MFDSMGIATASPGWADAAEEHLRVALGGDDVRAAVVDDPTRAGRLVASGVIEFQRRIPSPSNPTGRAAYVSNMSTDEPWRRQGLARAVLSWLLEEARRRSVRRVELHATPEGAGLYAAAGFVSRDGGLEMRLDIGELR
jgi:GNAT superfamily N-acetyltransferase